MSTIGKTWRRSNEYDLTSYDYGVCYFHNNPDEFFIFDKEDYDVLNNHCWAKSTSNGYATARIGSTSSATAQSVIMGCPPDGMVIDHINRNRLDNRKSNLRFTTRKENARNRGTMSNNTSGYTGVHYQKASRKWRASIAVDYQRIQLGEFDTKEDAYDAYIQAREIPDGTAVKIDAARILANHGNKLTNYLTYVKEHRGEVFHVSRDDPKANNAMVVFAEDKTPVKWLWHTSDLIVVKEGNDV